MCSIDGATWTAGAVKSDDPCRVCQPATSTTTWTPAGDGFSCGLGKACLSGTCAARTYRVALVNQKAGGVDVVDFVVAGTPTVVRSLSMGWNSASPSPAWSADGTQLAYPAGGSGLGSTYLFDVEAASTNWLDWMPAIHPDYAKERLRVVGNNALGQVVRWDGHGQTATTTIPGRTASRPKFDSSDSARFAFLDAASSSLALHAGGSAAQVADGVVDFGWRGAGGGLVVLRRQGTSCEVRAIAVTAGAPGASSALASGADCTARLRVAPAGKLVALVRGADVFVADGAGLVDLASATPTLTLDQPVLDADFTPDGTLLALLKGTPAYLYVVQPSAGAQPVAVTSGSYQGLRMSPSMH
ncbi:MAG: hypothetical protein QM765_29365 [Myxococcales bacterium]